MRYSTAVQLQERDMARSGVVRKNLRLTQEKIDRAKKILGTQTETETVEHALDLVAFREEVVEGIRRIAGSRGIEDIHGEDDAA
jgi:Arc/MetJ-type ribon-helix-helix transcriptional regulator